MAQLIVQNLRVENATGGEPSIMQVPNLGEQ
jgi:hypothetical protein